MAPYLDPGRVNIATLLWDAAERRPTHPAIVDREQSVDYDTLRDRTTTIAAFLRALGVGRADRVAIFLERGVDAVASIFAVHALGGTAVVVNDRLRPRQIEHILAHATCSALVTMADMLQRLPRPLETSATVLDLGTVAGPCRGLRPQAVTADDFAHIIFTSGSTGLPKGVAFTHGQLGTGVSAVREYLGLREDDRVAGLLGFSSVYGLNQLLCTVASAATFVIESSPVPHQIVSALKAREVTVLAAVPPLWLQILSAPEFSAAPIPSLRQLQNAGGHLPVDAVRRLRRAQPQAQLFLQYGMTETFRSTFLPPSEVDSRPDSMGRAVTGNEILVLREDGTPCDTGEIGELVHRGPTVAAGYWGDTDRSARTFRSNHLRPVGAPDVERIVFSGDMVRRDADGYLYFVSRRDRLIKALGYRVGPDEIVDVLFASGQIAEGVVLTEPDPQVGQRIVARVVLRNDGSVKKLEQFSRAELPRYMQPARFEIVDHLPRMASGKYDLAPAHSRQTVESATSTVGS